MNGYSYPKKLQSCTKEIIFTPQNPSFTSTVVSGFSFNKQLNFFLVILLLLTVFHKNNTFAKNGVNLESLPIANPDTVSVCPPLSDLTINVLNNDVATENPIKGIYQIFVAPENHGTLTVSADSTTITYSADTPFSGQDVFSYQIQDINGLVSAPAALVINSSCSSSGFIAGVAFTDTDANGTQNPDENGFEGLIVSLFNAVTGQFLTTATTDADGYYIFPNLPDGQYWVQVSEADLSGLFLTTPAEYEITISGGGNFVFADFGLTTCSGVNITPNLPDIYLCSNPVSPITICLSSTDTQGDPINITSVHSLFDCGITILNDTCIQYIALPAFFGVDTLHIEVCDQHTDTCSGSSSLCSNVTAIITVPCPNAQNDVVTTPVNTPVSVNVLANDIGVPPLSVAVITQPANGNATVVGNQIVYTPNPGFVGTDNIVYQITDPNGNTDEALVTIYVIPGGELPPNAQNDNIPCPFSISGSGTLTPASVLLNVLDNDTDPNGNLSGIIAVGMPVFGTAVIVSGNNILYTPSSAYLLGNITEEFYYVVADATGLTDTAWVTITCSLTTATPCVNANPDAQSIPAGGTASLNVLANDTYCANCNPTPSACTPLVSSPQIVAITISTPAANGTVTVNNNGTEDTGLNYVPNPGFSGTDVFTYTACTADGLCDNAVVTINVLPPASEQQLIANDDIVATPQNTALTITLLGNDQLCLPPLPCLPPLSTGQLLDITIFEQPANGSVWVNSFSGSDVSVTYTPISGFTGSDVFQYIVCSIAQGLCDTATVTVYVTGGGTNNPPVAVDDYHLVTINTPLTSNALENDFDPDGDPISIVAIVDGPSNGTATIAADGQSITYVPNTNFTGNDTLSYQISDGALTDIALIIIFVEGSSTSNTPPVAVDDFVSTPPNTPIGIAVLSNDYDPNGDAISVVAIVTPPLNGTSAINPDGSITYTPDPGFTGTDTFTYQITDGELNDIAQVVVFVEGVIPDNLPPVANDDAAGTPPGIPVTIPVLANDTDPNGDPISIVGIDDQPNHGFVFINPDGSITYNPDPGFTGTDTFTYQITDGELTDVGTVVVFINDLLNLPPVANDDVAATPPGTPVTIPVLDNDTDPNGDPISIVAIDDQPNHGFVFINPDGSITYNPDPGFTGTDTFTYQITDGELTDVGTVVIVVEDLPNQPPVAVTDTVSTPQDTPIDIAVIENDFDPEGNTVSVVTTVAQPENGVAYVNPDGTITYNPNPGFSGTDTFTYEITDGELTAIGTVIVTVIEDIGNLPPVANDDVAATPPGTPVTILVLDNDTDPNGDPISVVAIDDQPNHGFVFINPDGSITYNPDPGFTGTDTFTYQITDGELTDVGTVVIVVDTLPNLPPVANDDAASTAPGTPVTIPVLANDTDPNGDPISVVAIDSQPNNGFVFINLDGSITYNPDPGFTGTDTFTYVISDGLLTDTAEVIVSVNDTINEAPIAVDDVTTTTVDTPVVIPVLDNDSDPNGDPLTVVAIVDEPTNGTVVINPDGTVTYTPDTSFIGTDTFTYVISDGLLTDTAQVIVSVNDTINQAPVAVDDVAETTVDTPVTIPVLDNDSDPNGDPITVVAIVDEPNNGTAVINPDGTVTYTPDTSFIGTDTFTYVISDGLLTDTAVVIVSVNDTVNEAPLAVDDAASTAVDTPVIIPVLDNDSDPNGDPLTVVAIVDEPTNGTVVINPDGTVTYTPDTSFVGTDTFTYVISDGLLTDTAVVIVSVNDTINEAPVAVDDAVSTDVGTPVIIPVLDNDSDPNGDPLTVVAIVDEPANGTVVINPDGTVTYTPDTSFVGTDTFTYVISDGLLTDTAVVIVSVNDTIGDAPVAVDDAASTDVGTPVIIPVLDNDSDPNGDLLTVVDIVDEPANGTVVINPDGTVTYTPDTSFIGTDTFTYVISDGLLTDTAQVVVSVNDTISNAPVAVDDSISTTVDTPVIIPVLDNDSDPNGDPLTVVDIVDGPANGTVVINPDGTVTYTPDTSFIGTDTFTYVISDGLLTDTAEVIVLVSDIANLPPLAVDDSVSTGFETPIIISVLDNDTDPNGDVLAVVIIDIEPANGTTTINLDGTITYTPNNGFEGIDTFTYIITDGEFNDTAQVIVVVGNPDNEPPIAVDDAASTPLNEAVDIAILSNDSDPNGDVLTVVAIVVDPVNGTAVLNPDGTVTYTPNTDFFGTDTFTYVITDGTQTDTAVVTITVESPDCADLFIPNGFSPNGDGINDLFLIQNLQLCYPDNELVIFNRWGDEVFRQKGYSVATAWNGAYQQSGKRVPDGTYFYVLMLNGEGSQQRNGYIEICR